MEEIKRNKLLINLKYHNIEEFKISDSDSLILLSESDINNKYFFEIKDYLTSLKKDLLNHFDIKNFSILSDKFGGSYSILHIRYDSISIFTNSNYIGLFYTIFENNSILITDSLDLISSELNYKLNIKELNYRNEYLLESP